MDTINLFAFGIITGLNFAWFLNKCFKKEDITKFEFGLVALVLIVICISIITIIVDVIITIYNWLQYAI